MSLFRNKSKVALVIALSLMLSILVPAFTVPAVAVPDVDADDLFSFEATQISKDYVSLTIAVEPDSYIRSVLFQITFDPDLLEYYPAASSSEGVHGLIINSNDTCAVGIIAANRITREMQLADLRFRIKAPSTATTVLTVSSNEINVTEPDDYDGNNTKDITSTFSVKNLNCKLGPAVNEIRLDSTLRINAGDSSVLSAEVLPADAFNKTLTWSVESGAAFASVAQDGTVTAIAEGEAVIAVKDITGSVVARCTVTVTDIPRQIIPLDTTDSVSIDRDRNLLFIYADELNPDAVAALFKNENLNVFAENGTPITGTNLVPSGAELRLEIDSELSDVLTVIIVGDANADGTVTTDDARLALRVAVGLDTIEGFRYYSADVLGTDNRVTTDDARKILRAAVGLDTL